MGHDPSVEKKVLWLFFPTKMPEDSQANSSMLCVEQNGRFATAPRPARRSTARPCLSIHDHRVAAQRASGVADSLCQSKLAYRKETDHRRAEARGHSIPHDFSPRPSL